jgi:uncharacterized membrane protein
MWNGRSLYEVFLDLMNRHQGKVVGVIIGLLAGLLIIIFGFWRTVFIAICILAGFFLGKRFDDEGGLGALWKRFFGE